LDLRAVAPEVGEAEVVREDQDDVRRGAAVGRVRRRGGEGDREERGDHRGLPRWRVLTSLPVKASYTGKSLESQPLKGSKSPREPMMSQAGDPLNAARTSSVTWHSESFRAASTSQTSRIEAPCEPLFSSAASLASGDSQTTRVTPEARRRRTVPLYDSNTTSCGPASVLRYTPSAPQCTNEEPASPVSGISRRLSPPRTATWIAFSSIVTQYRPFGDAYPGCSMCFSFEVSRSSAN